MRQEENLHDARAIMLEFADRSGLTNPGNPPRRYLWTDAHAVCNFLSLYRKTRNDEYRQLALSLVDQVHSVLGKHREDDPRQGWISGLSDQAGALHPTAGGLRIGKTLNERRPDEAYDGGLEWDRDGQYFHYLSKWMHALYRASAVTGEPQYCRWAIELAKAAHAGFARAVRPGGSLGLLWKMSIDLSYPLVPSFGLHDPLDGFVTYNELGLCPDTVADHEKRPDLNGEIADAAVMIEGQQWASDDPLGIGGLLFDACRILQLNAAERLETQDLVVMVIRDVKRSLESFASQTPLGQQAQYRLAFRELGLSIGLKAVGKMQTIVDSRPDVFDRSLATDLEELQKYVPLGQAIENFWRDPGHQQADSWLEHLDINNVMLATSLLPDEFLAL
jgi:hypothetical protein